MSKRRGRECEGAEQSTVRPEEENNGMESKRPAILRIYDRPTTDCPTERPAHREVSLPRILSVNNA